MKGKGFIPATLAFLIGGVPTGVQAAGYAVFTQGASALGQGNAVTAHTDSPNTIFYNPALINKLDGTQVELGTTVIFSSREFQTARPEGSTSNRSTFFPSTFYATHKFNDNLSAGLGIFSPFGLGTKWDENWEGRYLATKSELTSFNINPVVSYRIIPSLAVAVGLDVILVDATLERKIHSGTLGIPGPAFDIGSKFKGDGTGVGFNTALAYQLSEEISFGVSYRSEVKVEIKGDSGTSPAVAPLNSKGKTSIRLPQQLTAGVSYQVSEPLTVEAGVRWEGWSSFKKLQLMLDNGTPLPPTQRDWHDSFGLNLGGKYRLNDTVALLAGYVYGNSSVPDSTFDPSIPDSDTHVFCAGTDLNYQKFKIALSYAYQLYENRTRNSSVEPDANGVYKSDAHLLALGVGYRF